MLPNSIGHICEGQSRNCQNLFSWDRIWEFCTYQPQKQTPHKLQATCLPSSGAHLCGWQLRPPAQGHSSSTPSGSRSQVMRLRSLLEGSWQGSPSSGKGVHTGNRSSAGQGKGILGEVFSCLLNWGDPMFNSVCKIKKEARPFFKFPYVTGSHEHVFSTRWE